MISLTRVRIPSAVIDLRGVELQWFAYLLLNQPKPTVLSDRVNFEVMGADAWEHAGALDSLAKDPVRLYFAAEPPRNYRDWKSNDYSFYDAAARVLHDEGVLCEPDSRKPWFVCAAHDDGCLRDTLAAFEIAIERTLRSGGATHRVPA